MSDNGSMSIWQAGTPSIITIIGPKSLSITGYYRKRGSAVPFEKFSGEFLWRGENVWELQTTLAEGEYVVRVDINEDELLTQYIIIKAVNIEDYSNHITNELIKNQLNNLINKAIDSTNNKIVG